MQVIDDVTYKLSNSVELIIWCRSPALTLFEQYSYLVLYSMYNPSDIDNIDYVLILSLSRSPSYCINGRISVTSTVNRYISSTVLCQTLTSSVMTGICEVTVRMVFIIGHLSNTLHRLLAVVRTSIYDNTACILRIVSMGFIASSV